VPRPCQALHPLDPAGCHLCRWWVAPGPRARKVRAAWGPAAPCRHLGPETGKVVECPGCRGVVRLKLLSCALHGVCTAAREVPGVRCCAGCDTYGEPGPDRYPPVSTRGLAFHVYPLRNGPWRRQCDHLLRRRGLFNGRRVVAIVTDHNTDPAGAVREAFRGFTDEFLTFLNDPALREVVTTIPLLERFRGYAQDPGAAVLLCHAKGVTRPSPGETCHAWADLLWETLADYWPLVDAALADHPVAGSLMKLGAWFAGSAGGWHYSGSFAWLRCAELFARDWRRIDRQWWGVESYPGLHFTADEAGVVFGSDLPGAWGPAGGRVLDLYNPPYLSDVVLPALARWRVLNAQHRREWPC
jgi:hypothetical protein